MSTETKKRVSDIAEAIEPYDKVWGVGASGFVVDPSPFERVNLILDDTEKTTNGDVYAQRAVVVTEELRAHEEEPLEIQWAHAMAAWFCKCPIIIYDHELVVGTLGCYKKGCPVFPEFGLEWIIDEMETGKLGYSEIRTHDCYFHTPETLADLKSVQEYWRHRSVDQKVIPLLTEEEKRASHLGEGVFLGDAYMYGGAGHLGISTERLFYMGYGGIHQEILDRMAELDPVDPEDQKRMISLKADLIVNEAATEMINRYADKAEEMAAEKAESDPTRAEELRQIAANCRQIASGTPQTFWQALQALHFAHTMVQMESNGHSISYGRFDQFMFPYYKRDIESGYMTREQMQELIECFNIKIWDMNKVRSLNTVQIFANGGIGGPALTVGGLLPDGTDGTNDLTFMFLDAIAHTRVPTPWTAVRLSLKTPEELKIKVANLIRLGLGEPKIFNDEVTIETMVKNGRSYEDSANYQVVGCVEPDATGKEYGWHDAAYFNCNRVLELAINHGYTHDGHMVGPDTGGLEEFETFDQVLESYDKQMEYYVTQMQAFLNKLDYVHQNTKPLPFVSNLIEGCVESGTDATKGGAIYNFTGPQGVGVGSVGDGLSTIKKLVFEEKAVTAEELLQAVADNWVGHEKLYALVNSDHVPHYGNDDDYADELAKFGIETYCKHVNGKPTAHGGHFQAGVYSVAVNVALGMFQDASVEGRVSGEPISDCMGATHTHCCPHDIKGPAAICKSVTKIDHSLAGNGTLLNWKFSPAALEGDAGRDAFISLLDDYVARKGMHSQFTVASRETLDEAQKHPEDYRDLLVRVAGYSAYFVELSKELQDDIIGRTELSF
ncbi:MAG: glycyl radical protein [Coriobacteriales bacterium]|jgi:pyruvate formate-lyase/glycerol dehydratase family glycyl radical enzyme